jgi:hypothetical protein
MYKTHGQNTVGFTERRLFGVTVVVGVILSGALVQGCGSGPTCLDMENNPPRASLGRYVNSVEDDFAPLLLNDTTLIFTSNRGKDGAKLLNEWNRYGEDLFVSYLRDGNWSEAEVLQVAVRSKLNEGTATIAADGHTAIVSRSYGPRSVGGADLYTCEFNGETFVNLKDLGRTVNSKYWDAQPALSPDGQTLIFASDRPGGVGGADLWSSRKEGGGWSAPINLGDSINTNGNEYSPFITTVGGTVMLFFSSDGRPEGHGMLDLFCAQLKADGSWSKPVSPPTAEEVNTSFNESFPCVSKDLRMLYFASDRVGGCGRYDLYALPLLLKLPPAPIILAGTVRDAAGKPLPVGAEVVVREKPSGRVAAIIVTTPPLSTFQYQVTLEEGVRTRYALSASAECYVSTEREVAVEGKTVQQRLTTDLSLPQRWEFTLDPKSIPFYVTGYYRLNLPENLRELHRLLQGPLNRAGYIDIGEANSDKYAGYADQLRQYFHDSLQTPLTKTILPNFRDCLKSNEIIHIKITGYADPRKIAEGYTYLEDDVSFKGVAVRRGAVMTNDVLTDLRAYYAMKYIDQSLVDSSEVYRSLKREGRIDYDIVGAGADVPGGRQLEYVRRVVVEVSRVPR